VSPSDPATSPATPPPGDGPALSPAADGPATDVAAKKEGTDWWGELKAIFWLILGVLAFHSLIAKPFYIPSESMMPVLLKGDRLVVTKYPYGWSWVSPSFHILPPSEGRLFGRMPERGDIVILTPRGQTSDYIKRVIGLPGDTIEMVGGTLYINGKEVRREARPPALIPVDENVPCNRDGFGEHRVAGADGKLFCRLPVMRETLPNGVSYDTIDMGYSPGIDDFARIKVPAGHVWVMGDNRDKSADSRVPAAEQGLDGPVPWENIGGRAEFITFSLDGSSQYLNPISWFTAMRGGRSGTSLRPEEAKGE
jgi:signal peptidase I